MNSQYLASSERVFCFGFVCVTKHLSKDNFLYLLIDVPSGAGTACGSANAKKLHVAVRVGIRGIGSRIVCPPKGGVVEFPLIRLAMRKEGNKFDKFDNLDMTLISTIINVISILVTLASILVTLVST